MSAGGAAEKAVAKEAEHVIAKAVQKAGVRDAEVLSVKSAERAGAHDAERSVAHDGARAIVDPHAHVGPDVIDHTKPGGDLIPHDYDRFGGKSEDEFLGEHWDPDKVNSWDGTQGNWRYPPHEGFDGASRDVPDVPTGYRFDRFGGEGGDFVSPVGTRFGQRALPPDSLDKPYHVYRTTRPFDGASGVPRGGRIAPAFEQGGGGIQLKLPRSVQWLLDNNYIEEVTP